MGPIKNLLFTIIDSELYWIQADKLDKIIFQQRSYIYTIKFIILNDFIIISGMRSDQGTVIFYFPNKKDQ